MIHKALELYTILLQHSPAKLVSFSMHKENNEMFADKNFSWFKFEMQAKKDTKGYWNESKGSNTQVQVVPHTVQNTVVWASLNATLANPKSQIFNLQFALANMFFGFKSRWYTLAADKWLCYQNKSKTFFIEQ